MARLFSRYQRKEHDGYVGHQCEWEIEKYQRCTEKVVEADHLQSHSKGGKTEEENMEYICKPHHYIKHLLDEEPWSAILILRRMSDGEKKILKALGFIE